MVDEMNWDISDDRHANWFGYPEQVRTSGRTCWQEIMIIDGGSGMEMKAQRDGVADSESAQSEGDTPLLWHQSKLPTTERLEIQHDEKT